MSRLTQRQASSVWGVARATLQRAIKAGKVSKDAEGKVDTTDLLRVFGEPKKPTQSHQIEPEKATDPTAQLLEFATRNGRLQAENEALRELLASKDQNLTDLRGEVQRLTHERVEAVKKRRWWSR